jgi:uncharacterized lipoprotein YddW (UPF0748 family)
MRLLSLLLLGLSMGCLEAAEVRGVWAARDSLGSRQQIRTMMRNLAEANFNLVYVLVWSQGYPLWHSRVFERETGLLTDPQYGGRDILREAVEEAREVGLTVIPWVEYGFIGGWSARRAGPEQKGPIFERHPDWVLKKKDGDHRYLMADGSFFTWMIPFHPDVQSFLLELMGELIRDYDVPGLQFDRARLPALDSGYDAFTRELYAAETGEAGPPAAENAAAWVRWRADKLNEFVAKLYRTLKDQDWRTLIPNAPGVYPFGYVNFAQDYPAWWKQGALDFVTPQVYRATHAAYVQELDRQIAALGDVRRLVAGIDITNSNNPDVLVQMIESTRERGLPGVVIWYYQGLVRAGALERLKTTVYKEKAELPFRTPVAVVSN